MIHVPFAMCLVAVMIHKDHTNLAAAGLFIIFYSFSLLPHLAMEESPIIFEINLMMTALFYVMLAGFSKVTKMIVIFCITDIILTLVDVAAFLSYHYRLWGLYEFAYKIEGSIVLIQWAALWVTDGKSVNVMGFCDNIIHSVNDIKSRLLYR